jgi:hypothetical protein
MLSGNPSGEKDFRTDGPEWDVEVIIDVNGERPCVIVGVIPKWDPIRTNLIRIDQRVIKSFTVIERFVKDKDVRFSRTQVVISGCTRHNRNVFDGCYTGVVRADVGGPVRWIQHDKITSKAASIGVGVVLVVRTRVGWWICPSFGCVCHLYVSLCPNCSSTACISMFCLLVTSAHYTSASSYLADLGAY